MELLGLFDNSGIFLNKSIVRGDKNFNDGENIKLTTVWIKCGDKYLVQKCSKQKGGEYAISGGHVSFGNSSKEQAVIELNEELGLEIDINSLKFLGNIYRSHAIFDVHIIEDDNLSSISFKLQESEVEAVYWMTKEQINQLILNNEFRSSSKEQFEKFIK